MKPGDPGDPTSPGEHITDDGVRYTVHRGGHVDDGLSAILAGREVDVVGLCFKDGLGWPSILVELNLALLAVTGPGSMADPVDMMPDDLARRHLRPVDSWTIPPEVDKIRYTVRRRAGRLPSGLYGPAGDGEPGAWRVIAPLPPWPGEFDAMLPEYGGQMGVYVTTHSRGLCDAKFSGGLREGLAAQIAAGRLYGTRAAVIP